MDITSYKIIVSACAVLIIISLFINLNKNINRRMGVWNVRWKRIIPPVIVRMSHAAERANVVSVFIITGRMTSCLRAFLIKDRSGRTIDQYVTLSATGKAVEIIYL